MRSYDNRAHELTAAEIANLLDELNARLKKHMRWPASADYPTIGSIPARVWGCRRCLGTPSNSIKTSICISPTPTTRPGLQPS